MYLSPHTTAGLGNLCSKASEGCAKACLYTAGRGAFSNVQRSRVKKTTLFFKENKLFMETLFNDLNMFNQYCSDNGIQGYVRLNGTSDIDWQKLKHDSSTVFEKYSNIVFYDYTKDYKRESLYKNYSLTYSRSETTTEKQIKALLKKGLNVSVVFDKLPSTWSSVEVINGDLNDLRPLDKRGIIVGLVAKGLAKKDDSGFVVNTSRIKTLTV